MEVARRSFACALWACVLAAGGCNRVKVTFVNQTGDYLDVHLASPEAEREYLGVIAPMGFLEHGLAIDKDDLPADCTWTAATYSGRFLVDGKTEKKMRIEIGP